MYRKENYTKRNYLLGKTNCVINLKDNLEPISLNKKNRWNILNCINTCDDNIENENNTTIDLETTFEYNLNSRTIKYTNKQTTKFTWWRRFVHRKNRKKSITRRYEKTKQTIQ